MMLIRPARTEDIDRILDLGALMHAESAYAFLPFDREKVRRHIASYFDDPETNCGLVAVEDNRIAGMFGGYLADYFFCTELVACDTVLFVDKQYRGSSAAPRLIRAFRDWARARGATEICLSISTQADTERTGRFYERMGLSLVGGVYKQKLK